MHPSEKIKGEKSSLLSGKRIALCITGSISAVESVKLARELIRHGAEVYPYLTKAALKFIGENSLLFATGYAPVIELTGNDEHLYDFDIILVAPATADIISKTACGIADDAVSTLLLANLSKNNIVFVPAMGIDMYKNPILKSNIEKLKNYAVFIKPKIEEDKAKLPDIERIVAEVMHNTHTELKGKNILIIGGAGYEKFDDFRIITNLATGKTGIDLAKYAYYYGANVKLMIGLHSENIPEYIDAENFGELEDLLNKINEFENFDAIIVPAALPDFKPIKKKGKVKEIAEFNQLNFKENPKFLKELRSRYKGFLIGFKAETQISRDELIKRARERMKEYSLDIIVANLIEDVKYDSTKAVIIFNDEDFEEFEGSKNELAKKLIDILVESL